MANFTLHDTAGKPVSLYGFRGKKAVVLVFTGIDCPVGNLYMPRLAELAKAYKDKGVVFLAINANAHETAEQVAEHARAHGLDFPVLKDPGNRVADLLLVERTCEVLVLDGRARLRYRGAIDDQYGRGARKDGPAQTYLREALDAVLAGEEVETPATPVVGCPIDRVEPKPGRPDVPKGGPRVRPAAPEIVAALEEIEAKEPVEVGQVTYAADVAPILQDEVPVVPPPRPGRAVLAADLRRRPPPGRVDPRGGRRPPDAPLARRPALRPVRERPQPDRPRAGHAAGLGRPGDAPGRPRGPPRPQGRSRRAGRSARPTSSSRCPSPTPSRPRGCSTYVNFRVPTDFTEDRWVQAAEARPGDRSVVHHIIVYVDDHDQDRAAAAAVASTSAATPPATCPRSIPPGTAKQIPAGSDLIFQIHYTPIGKIRTDRSTVGLIFAKAPVTHQAYTHGIAQQRFVIPPGADNYPVASSFTFPTDAHLLSFMPHMHLRGKDFQYTATYPDGPSEVLLSVPAYDFGWQSYYRLAEPKAMPQGTRIDCLAHFDNSADNPANPDPTKAVSWGEQTFEEMMIGYIDYVEDAPIGSEAARPEARALGVEAVPSRPPLRLLRLLGRRPPSRIRTRPGSRPAFAGGPAERLHGRCMRGRAGRIPSRRGGRFAMIRGVIAGRGGRGRARRSLLGRRRRPGRGPRRRSPRSSTWSAAGRGRASRRPTASRAGPRRTSGPGSSPRGSRWR